MIRLTHYPVDKDAGFVTTGAFLDVSEPAWSPQHPHLGHDLGNGINEGYNAYAMGSGVLVEPVNDGTFGNTRCIKLDGGEPGEPRFLLYAHLRDTLFNIGDRVEVGQLIGHIGHTSTMQIAAHLHLQLCVDQRYSRNPDDSADPFTYYHPEDEDDMALKDDVAQLRTELNETRANLAMAIRVLCANKNPEQMANPIPHLTEMDKANFDLEQYLGNINTAVLAFETEVRTRLNMPEITS